MDKSRKQVVETRRIYQSKEPNDKMSFQVNAIKALGIALGLIQRNHGRRASV